MMRQFTCSKDKVRSLKVGRVTLALLQWEVRCPYVGWYLCMINVWITF